MAALQKIMVSLQRSMVAQASRLCCEQRISSRTGETPVPRLSFLLGNGSCLRQISTRQLQLVNWVWICWASGLVKVFCRARPLCRSAIDVGNALCGIPQLRTNPERQGRRSLRFCFIWFPSRRLGTRITLNSPPLHHCTCSLTNSPKSSGRRVLRV